MLSPFLKLSNHGPAGGRWAGGPPFAFLQVTTHLGALPFPDVGKGRRSGSRRVFASPGCPVRLDLDGADVSGEVVTKAGPEPVFRFRDQSASHRIAVYVFELLDGLLVVPHIEIEVTTLPESYVSRPLEPSR